MHDIQSEKYLAQEFCVMWFKQTNNQTDKSKILWIQQLMSWGVEFSRFTSPSNGTTHFHKLYCLRRQTALLRGMVGTLLTQHGSLANEATWKHKRRILRHIGPRCLYYYNWYWYMGMRTVWSRLRNPAVYMFPRLQQGPRSDEVWQLWQFEVLVAEGVTDTGQRTCLNCSCGKTAVRNLLDIALEVGLSQPWVLKSLRQTQ
jgi:hypothetical protein